MAEGTLASVMRGLQPREPLVPLIKEYLGFLKGLLKGIYKGSIRELRNIA